MKPVILQTQPTPHSCVSACLAMLLDVPVEEVHEEFHFPYRNFEMSILEYAHKKGMMFVSGQSDSVLYYGMVYLLAVPSLNIKSGVHQIIVDTRNHKFQIYDPNEGYAGRLFYSEAWEPGASLLNSYTVDFKVLWCPLMGDKPNEFF